MHCAQLLAVVEEQGPDPVKDALALPALQRPVHRGVVAELAGQAVPLTAGAGAVDDAVQAAPRVGPWPALLLGRVELRQQWPEDLVVPL
jgi:hypothetical protein